MTDDELNPPIQTRRRSRWGLVSRIILLGAVIPYFGFTAFMTLFQRSFLYHPVAVQSLSVADVGLEGQGIQDVSIQTDGGVTLQGWLLKAAQDADRTSRNLVVYFPGNARNRSVRLNDLQSISESGYDVLIFDYRGYADSSGLPSETGLSSDARQIWSFAVDELQYSEDRIVVYGESLGGAVALSLWSGEEKDHPHPRAVMLRATFTTMADTVSWHYPIFPFRWLLFDQWPSIDRIPEVGCEVVIFHGTSDGLVPFQHAQLLAKAASDATLIELPGGNHHIIPKAMRAEQLRRFADR